jgi:hypothetical protein
MIMATPTEPTSESIEPTSVVQGNPEAPGPNPAWNDVLNVIPEQFHQTITPHFQKWDQAANSRIESIKSQYADYQPFIDHGIGRDSIEQGLRLMQMVNDDPKQVYEALAASLGINLEQPQQPQTPDPNQPNGETGEASQSILPPGYEQLQQGMEYLAQQHLQQQEAQEVAKAGQELDANIAKLKAEKGDFNEAYFLPYLANGVENGKTFDQVATEFFAMRDDMAKSIQANQPFTPRVMGAASGNGVGLPSNAIDPSKLSGKETRNLVVEYLKHAATQQ